MALEFLDLLFIDLTEKQISIPVHWDIDHLCYRSDSLSQYDALKKSFATFAHLLIESDVNGRPIATYKLNQAIHFKEWMIDVVELPAPKASKPTSAGFEHIEVVCDVPFAYFEKHFSRLNLHTEGQKKDFNQELEIHLGQRNLKFHHLSLESVINTEKSKAFSALHSSAILKDFKKYRPLVAGTIPLGVEVADSDLDILMTSENLHELRDQLTLSYSGEENFSNSIKAFSGADTLLCNFTHQGTDFEIFAQSCESVQQTAYAHFQIEERLLKIKGPNFRQQILKLRQEGSKTEPAFATALGIDADPYLTLLKLQKLSNRDLQRL